MQIRIKTKLTFGGLVSPFILEKDEIIEATECREENFLDYTVFFVRNEKISLLSKYYETIEEEW